MLRISTRLCKFVSFCAILVIVICSKYSNFVYTGVSDAEGLQTHRFGGDTCVTGRASRNVESQENEDRLQILLKRVNLKAIYDPERLSRKTLLTVHMASDPIYVKDGFEERRKHLFHVH